MITECLHALKGLVLPRASHSCEIALADLRRLRSTLPAAPVIITHAVVTEAGFHIFKNERRSICYSGVPKFWTH